MDVAISSSQKEASVRQLDVLIIEDEPLIRWSLRRGLALRGHRVSEAGDGAEGLKALTAEAGRFDVVVLDYRLPDRQDLSLLRDVRLLEPGAAVIMMTAYGDQSMRDEAVALGVRGVVDKPFHISDFVSLIESAGYSSS